MSDEIDDLVDAITEIPFQIPVSEFELSRFDDPFPEQWKFPVTTQTTGAHRKAEQ